MRKNLKNNIAAKLTATALATMIAFTSIPVQVFAKESTNVEEAAATEETNETTETAATEATEIDDAKEAIAAAEAACEELETTIEETASKEDGGAIAQEKVEDFVEKAENLGISEEVSSAAKEIKTVEEEIATAKEADKTADEKAAEAASNIAKASEIASEAVKNVEETKTQADNLVNIIKSSDPSSKEITDALDKLDEITNSAETDLETKKEVVEAISNKFEEAKKELEAAQKEYEETVKSLKSDIGSAVKAAKKLEDAKKDVDALSEAYDNAMDSLKKEQDLVNDIDAKKALSDKSSDWKTQNNLMKSIMTGYIIPNMIDKDATDITYSTETQRGFDLQNSSYCVVSYKDKDGNRVTRYFNIDRSDRQFKDNDQWYRLGNSREIIIYEKPEEDITSSLYQKQHFGKITSSTSEFRKDVNNGVYDVYAFEKADGSKEYKCIDEIKTGIENGTITEKDGVYYMNDAAGRKIVQTTSRNATGIKVSTKDDEGLKAYIENASKLVEKYEKFSETLNDTKDKIDEASDKVEALETVIGNIEENKSRRSTIVDGLKGYISEEDIAKLLAAESDEKAVEILEGILAGARNDLETASTELKEIITKREEIRKQLNDNDKVVATETTVVPETPSVPETPATPKTPSDTDVSSASGSSSSSASSYELDDEILAILENIELPENKEMVPATGTTAPAIANKPVNVNKTEGSNNEATELVSEAIKNLKKAEIIKTALAANANTASAKTALPFNMSTSASEDGNIWWLAFSIAVLEVLKRFVPILF
ncbi:MAG: hypothetical protein IK152_01320 [Lachnospiraceae bacterium]|nr:hypothetical protein [Lachnospiraceae bacterium]